MVSKKKIGLISVTLAVAAIMVLSGVGMMLYNGVSPASTPSHPASKLNGKTTLSPVQSLSAWASGTVTSKEPGYTGGVYKVASTINIGHMNIIKQSSLYAALLTDEIYDSAYQELPNGTYIPWLASSCSVANTSALTNHTTFDPLTGTWQMYNLSYTLHIVPGARWSDWTPTNATQTYTYSNVQYYYSSSGTPYSHTYSKYSSTTMLAHEVQSADFILSWQLLSQSTDYSTEFANVVNVIPVNNLTVEYLLSSTSATFSTYTRETPVLPYHVWSLHRYADQTGNWNYNSSMAAGTGYNDWELGYDATTGFAPGFVGTGPFMMVNGYNSTQGYYIANKGWELYANPYYFVQYTNSTTYASFTANNTWVTPTLWHQYTPKIYAVEYPYYATLSAAVTAMSEGTVQTITEGVTPSFVPVVDTFANTYIFHKASSGYGFMQLNSFSTNSPMNITAFRQALNYATDKAYLATVIDSGYDILGQPIIPPSDPLWRNDSTPSYSYNPAKAESLIAGIPGMSNVSGVWYYNGKEVMANIQITSAGPNPLGVEGALVIAQEWTSIGVPTTITQESFTTLIPNLVNYNYNVISLGITGIAGDPTGDYFAFYNYNLGFGTGFYLGPWSSINYGGKTLTGAQVNDTMNNLTVQLNAITNLVQRIQISDEIQGIAAIESTMINLGYGIDILPFTNTTFTNISEIEVPYASYMYWAVLTTHTRSSSLVTHYTSKFDVSVQVSNTTFFNGQKGTVVVSVTSNLTGKAVSGASVTVGVSPSGATINITNNTGVTNAFGQYAWKFTVLSTQPLVYTNQYFGRLNFTAVATGNSSVEPGIGYALANVLPQGLKVLTAPTPKLSGTAKQLYWMKFENSSTGQPISGFSYTIQVASGAILMTPAYAGQTETNTSSYNSFFAVSYYAVNDVNNPGNANMSSLSGSTGSNGTVYFWIQANSSYNYSSYGMQGLTYIFLGNMAQGTPVVGAPNYMLPAEWTTASNPNGFGLQQPVEYPVQMVSGTPNDTIAISVTSDTMAYNGNITVTATVTNSTGVPVKGYMVQLESQNVLGANRGFFTNTSGTLTLATNPNFEFGSSYLPAIDLLTNANGVASATFSPGFYDYTFNATGVLLAYAASPYVKDSAVPFDSFIITAQGQNGTTATPVDSVSVYSTPTYPPTYTVTFTEKALPAGTTWYVNLSNGQTNSSTSSTMTFELANGTYGYMLSSSDTDYLGTTGQVAVNGASVSQSAVFVYSYPVTFSESGLPAGTSWSVTVNGTVITTTSSTAAIREVNGTYTYTISPVAGYSLTTSYSGTFQVNGAPVTENLIFKQVVYTVTVTETGLPSGSNWFVLLANGTKLNSTSSTITFSEPNGTYSITVNTTVTNYVASSSSVSFTVSGQPASVSVSFHSVSKTTSNNTLLYVAIGVVVAVIVIGAAVGLMMRRKKPPVGQ
ncbi:MAG: ABC transporter substrate-binding protein [Thermoplasmata archaeon]